MDLNRPLRGLAAPLEGGLVGVDDAGPQAVADVGSQRVDRPLVAVQADGAKVITIEGLGSEDDLHPLQEAFWNDHALQCGYCTPGMIMSAAGILADNPNPTEEEVRHGLEGNLCRCTGYHNIVKAVLDAAKSKSGSISEARA